MKHQLLIFCIAIKLEEIKENRYAASIPENDEHIQSSSDIWDSLQAQLSAALTASLGACGEAVLKA